MYDCREGHGVITVYVSISFLFLFFFHQSSLYPIKIFAKMFLFTCVMCVNITRSMQGMCGASAAKEHCA